MPSVTDAIAVASALPDTAVPAGNTGAADSAYSVKVYDFSPRPCEHGGWYATMGPSLPTPNVPTPTLSFARLLLAAGMPYSTQLYFVLPSPGRVVINSANSVVPDGAFTHDNAGVDAVPSQV